MEIQQAVDMARHVLDIVGDGSVACRWPSAGVHGAGLYAILCHVDAG
jgi:hypothetical protein